MNTANLKNSLTFTIIASLVVASVAALWFVASYSKAAEPSSFRSFSVSGEGREISIPDIAAFSFSVLTQGGIDLAAVQQENTQKANGAIAFAKEQGIAKEDITTQNYEVTPRYQYFTCFREEGPCPPPEIVGYTVSQQTKVKVRDFSLIGDLLSGLVENGANTVSQLAFTIDDPTEVQNKTREEAIAKAKAKAEAMAKAGGFRLGRLLSIQESGNPISPPIPLYAQEGRGGALDTAAPSIEPGSQEITLSVTLTYEIR